MHVFSRCFVCLLLVVRGHNSDQAVPVLLLHKQDSIERSLRDGRRTLQETCFSLPSLVSWRFEPCTRSFSSPSPVPASRLHTSWCASSCDMLIWLWRWTRAWFSNVGGEAFAVRRSW
ncbi:hypothetical protein KP509_15G026900 [Ceratopteris richardii]|uniref:Secreted protein n=2 Tax=Ceratopteris richardii TaxID=49495 RepID=A0A8T2T6P9_CERRI|nr:hypothetical protein KP509_15G026900 [Ceratopteris richardii]